MSLCSLLCIVHQEGNAPKGKIPIGCVCPLVSYSAAPSPECSRVGRVLPVTRKSQPCLPHVGERKSPVPRARRPVHPHPCLPPASPKGRKVAVPAPRPTSVPEVLSRLPVEPERPLRSLRRRAVLRTETGERKGFFFILSPARWMMSPGCRVLQPTRRRPGFPC
jgi:hypothetical protein